MRGSFQKETKPIPRKKVEFFKIFFCFGNKCFIQEHWAEGNNDPYVLKLLFYSIESQINYRNQITFQMIFLILQSIMPAKITHFIFTYIFLQETLKLMHHLLKIFFLKILQEICIIFILQRMCLEWGKEERVRLREIKTSFQ